MIKKLLLVDYENVQKIDLSLLDESFRAIIFVGAKQNPPKAASKPATAHRFQRVDFQKIEGNGKNALDFHIAFQLGRTMETAPETECFVLSRDKGFDPLLAHLNKSGLKCLRLERLEDLVCEPVSIPTIDAVVCRRCHRASTIEHYGGQWCTNCGCFASPPDPSQLPSNQPGFHRERRRSVSLVRDRGGMAQCGWCNNRGDMTGGIYDDGEWMCGHCVAQHAR
ncbi:PIN domain-containing protein [Ralstonia sp. CHL-2022]|uniref:PIN domain-containing protein n=1 Tax=Ralstonia mojiangensis TaxID=2953895 RepID=UPI0021B343C5|nr:PIN domain-containing protein [Ralstonia mojiangensis]MCT7296342.1 PIN domain-containing protein [Ralstonia mojiangensis]